MKVYLAGRYALREKLKAYAEELEHIGITVMSSWLNTPPDVNDDGMGGGNTPEIYAANDLLDIANSDLLIIFNDTEDPRGGRHTEFGFALGINCPVLIVGERENIFHCLAAVHCCPTWEEALVVLTKIQDGKIMFKTERLRGRYSGEVQ